MNKVVRLCKTWIMPDLSIILFAVFMLVFIIGAVAWQVDRDHDLTIGLVTQDGDKFARALEEHVRQVLTNSDKYLVLLKNEYEGGGGVTPAFLRLADQIYRDNVVNQLMLTGADGETLSTAFPFTFGVDFSHAPEFLTHKATDIAGLYVGYPSSGRGGMTRNIPLSRRLNNPDGSFAGVVTIAVSADYFARFYQGMEFDERYVVRIVGLDGLLRSDNSGENYGRDVADAPVFRELAKAPEGFYHTTGLQGDRPLFISYRRLPDYPLIVQVGQPEAVFTPMRQRRAGYLGGAAAAGLFILFYTGNIIVRAHRQRDAEVRYHEAFHISPDSINIARVSDGLFIDSNQGFTRILGFAREEILGRSSLELGIWVDAAARDRMLATLARDGEIREGEAHFRHKDGTIIVGQLSAKPIVINGEACLLTVVRDITGRKQAETKLEHHRLELEAAYEQLAATEEELRNQYDEVLRVNAQIKEQNNFLATLQEVTVGLINEIELEPLLQKIVDQAAAVADTKSAFIALPSVDGKVLEVKAARGLYAGPDGVKRVQMGQGLMGRVFTGGQDEYIADYQAWKGRPQIAGAEQVSAIYAAPLRSGQETFGVLGVAYTDEHSEFTPACRELLKRLGELATVVLEKAKLHTDLQNSYLELTASHEELTANHEELVASDQELRNLLDKVVAANAKVEESYRTIEEIFNAVHDGIIVNDVDTGEILTVNRQITEMFGYTPDEFKELGIVAVATPANVDDALRRIRKTATGGPQLYERKTVDRFGRPLILEIKASPVVIDGKTRSVALMRDITARRRMEEELTRSQAQKLATYDAIPDLLILFNRQGLVLDHNVPPSFCDDLGITIAVGQKAADIFPPDAAYELADLIGQVLVSGKTRYYEFEWRTDSGRHSIEVRLVKVDADKALALFRNITEKRRMEERLEFLSLHDFLTGVFNRAYFEEAMQRLQSKGHSGIGVFVCDVDGLKLINDTLGHRHGDDLLRKVAAILAAGIKPPNFVARVGGDEFAVVLYEPTKQEMEALERHYRKAVEKYNQEAPQLPLSLSLGWAAAYDIARIDSVFKDADNNMYRQKMHQSHSVRGAIVQTMMRALEARDYITEGHAERLGDLMEKMGQRLQLPPAVIADLRLFAKFHDIGKVGIPDSILNKPGRLTDEEMAIMQRHCEIGFRIARSSPDLAPIADWVLKHQEHWNGQGYPLGLAGEDIPIECRILALVDAFDAMTSDRPYRRAMSWQEALAEIGRCAGSQFDPKLAAIFINLIEEETN